MLIKISPHDDYMVNTDHIVRMTDHSNGILSTCMLTGDVVKSNFNGIDYPIGQKGSHSNNRMYEIAELMNVTNVHIRSTPIGE